ncbi:MAG: RCC1 repeat- and reductase domain-containing protein, partial [Clostridiales bacterium]|nr:RCC1 repeat- and reductase domain-containing protein [Clostridiales bacterium]
MKKTTKLLAFFLALVMTLLGAMPIAVTQSSFAQKAYSGKFGQIAAGGGHSMAIKSDGSLLVWGANDKYQLGFGDMRDREIPSKRMDGVVFVSAGNSHSLAILNDGSLWAWGDNAFNQLGVDGIELSKTPTKIMDGVSFVSAGTLHSLAIKTDGSLWA